MGLPAGGDDPENTALKPAGIARLYEAGKPG